MYNYHEYNFVCVINVISLNIIICICIIITDSNWYHNCAGQFYDMLTYSNVVFDLLLSITSDISSITNPTFSCTKWGPRDLCLCLMSSHCRRHKDSNPNILSIMFSTGVVDTMCKILQHCYFNMFLLVIVWYSHALRSILCSAMATVRITKNGLTLVSDSYKNGWPQCQIYRTTFV